MPQGCAETLSGVHLQRLKSHTFHFFLAKFSGCVENREKNPPDLIFNSRPTRRVPLQFREFYRIWCDPNDGGKHAHLGESC